MTQKQAPTHKSVANVLQNAHSALGYLIGHAKQLQTWNEILYKHLPSGEQKHCKIGAFEQRILTLVVDSANWATKLRYQIPDLVKQLKKTQEFQSIKEIKCLVRPEDASPKKATPRPALSKNTRRLLQETSDTIIDPELKIALQRLNKS